MGRPDQNCQRAAKGHGSHPWSVALVRPGRGMWDVADPKTGKRPNQLQPLSAKPATVLPKPVTAAYLLTSLSSRCRRRCRSHFLSRISSLNRHMLPAVGKGCIINLRSCRAKKEKMGRGGRTQEPRKGLVLHCLTLPYMPPYIDAVTQLLATEPG